MNEVKPIIIQYKDYHYYGKSHHAIGHSLLLSEALITKLEKINMILKRAKAQLTNSIS